MKKRFLSLIILPTILLSNPFESSLDNEMTWLQEETFVISASRVKENIKKASASITVIEADTINKMGANSIMDVLRTVPGLGISQSNVYIDIINVRGIQTWFSEKILILLDGHSLNVNLLNGGATGAYKELPLEMVKRIEIIRGPASALYGENAFTALINIITKKAKDINGGEVVVKYGTNNTKNINMLFGYESTHSEFTANIGYISSDGDSRYIKSDSIGNSGYTNPTLKSSNAYLSYVHNNGFYAKGNYNSTEDGPNYGVTYALNDEDLSKKSVYFVEMGYKNNINDWLDLEVRTYYDNYETDNRWELYPEGYTNEYNTTYVDGMIAITKYTNIKTGMESLFKVKNENYTIVSGISYEIQKLKDPTQKANYNPVNGEPLTSLEDFSDPDVNFVSEQDRTFWAIYSEVLYDIQKNIRLVAGMRYDHYDDFGGAFNPRAGATWEIDPQNNLKVMYGEAFRAPTFAELYNTNNPALLGNPDLDPETLQTFEINLQNNTLDNLQASFTLFRTKIQDIITSENGQYINKGKVYTYGGEMEMKYRLYRGSYILANYTYQDPEDDNGEELANISNHEAYLALNYRINKTFNLYLDAKYMSAQLRAPDDTREKVESSVISNMTLIAKGLFADATSMKFSVYNMFNEQSFDSSTHYDYPIAKRSYMATFTYKF